MAKEIFNTESWVSYSHRTFNLWEYAIIRPLRIVAGQPSATGASRRRNRELGMQMEEAGLKADEPPAIYWSEIDDFCR